MWRYTIRLIVTLAFTILVAPLATRAQQADRMKTIGVLQPYAEHDPEGQRRFGALLRGLQDLGWQEGRNMALEIRYAGAKFDQLPAQIAELLHANVDLIVTAGTQPIQAARKATTSIPIVMATIGDPVGAGIVASLSRPGGNITGLSNQATELSAKRLEMLNDILHGFTRLAILWNPDNASASLKFTEIETAARALGIEVEPLRARLPSDIDEGFHRAAEMGIKAVMIADDVFLASHRVRVVDLAMQYRLLVSSEFRQFTDAGSLMSYGPDQMDMWRRAATHVDKILERCEARRPTRRAAHEVRVGDQPQEREGARNHDPPTPPRAGRRGAPIGVCRVSARGYGRGIRKHTHGLRVTWRGALHWWFARVFLAEQSTPPDCLQRALLRRSRFRQQAERQRSAFVAC